MNRPDRPGEDSGSPLSSATDHRRTCVVRRRLRRDGSTGRFSGRLASTPGPRCGRSTPWGPGTTAPGDRRPATGDRRPATGGPSQGGPDTSRQLTGPRTCTGWPGRKPSALAAGGRWRAAWARAVIPWRPRSPRRKARSRRRGRRGARTRGGRPTSAHRCAAGARSQLRATWCAAATSAPLRPPRPLRRVAAPVLERCVPRAVQELVPGRVGALRAGERRTRRPCAVGRRRPR